MNDDKNINDSSNESEQKPIGSNETGPGPIDALKRDLYRRGQPMNSRTRRSQLNRNVLDVRDDWGNDEEAEHITSQEKLDPKEKKYMKKFLIFSAMFFVVAVGIASYVLFGGGTVVSSQNVDISVSGPVSIDGGEVLTLQVDVKNNNATTLEVVDLLIEYPDGTRNSVDVSRELLRHRESLGNIDPRKVATKVVESILFGEEGVKKDIKLTVEYRVEGSNAIFSKERLYEVEIRSAPLTLNIDTPSIVNAGQNTELVLELKSNSSTVLKSVLLIADYPFGFEYKDSSKEAEFEDRIWKFGDIEPGGIRTLRISGVLEGQDTEERIFRFEVGTQSERDDKKISTPFLTVVRGLVIDRPFIGVNLVFDGSPSNKYVASPGNVIRADVVWRNNLPEKLSDLEIQVKMEGGSLDAFSVSARDGFFRSSDNTIVWDGRDNPELNAVVSGASGQESFSFSSLGPESLAGLDSGSEINLSVLVTAKSLSGNSSQEQINIEIDRQVIIESDLKLTSRSVHFVGSINNSGPIPPQVGKETTYTVIWSLTNAQNDVSNTEVKATLPSHIRYVGLTNPPSEDISFNQIGGEVTWRVGEIGSGSGFTSSPREVAFQVALVPSVSQIGSAPELLGNATVSGVDRFSKTTLTETALKLSTRITTDPQFSNGIDRVVE